LPNAGPRSLLKDGRNVESAELSRRLTTAGPIRRATARRLERLACHSSQVQSVLSLEGEFTFYLLFQLIRQFEGAIQQIRGRLDILNILCRFHGQDDARSGDKRQDGHPNDAAILIMTAAIGIQIGIGTEIDEKARNSTPIAIAISISISTVQMRHN
jgi:hypothetical protein